MRHVATDRKNWMLKGSVAAGERATNLLTIVGSAIRNDVDDRAYLDDVLRRVLARRVLQIRKSPAACRRGVSGYLATNHIA